MQNGQRKKIYQRTKIADCNWHPSPDLWAAADFSYFRQFVSFWQHLWEFVLCRQHGNTVVPTSVGYVYVKRMDTSQFEDGKSKLIIDTAKPMLGLFFFFLLAFRQMGRMKFLMKLNKYEFHTIEPEDSCNIIHFFFFQLKCSIIFSMPSARFLMAYANDEIIVSKNNNKFVHICLAYSLLFICRAQDSNKIVHSKSNINIYIRSIH